MLKTPIPNDFYEWTKQQQIDFCKKVLLEYYEGYEYWRKILQQVKINKFSKK